MIAARPLAERDVIATAMTVKTIPVTAARIRNLVVADILVPRRVDCRL
jgi:hypothetical protein